MGLVFLNSRMTHKAPPLTELLHLSFADTALLEQALTHASYAHAHKTPDNERLEFLGDAILSAIVAEALYAAHPAAPEGELTRMRAQCVQGKSLAAAARALGLEAHLRHKVNEPTAKALDNLLEQAFEALVGACFLELGYEKTKEIVLGWLTLEKTAQFNAKGALQELLQPKVAVEEIEYRLAGTTGPDHNRVFTVELWVKGKRIAEGTGNSKKAAEEDAAQGGLRKMGRS